MEDRVGLVWHKLITKYTQPNYPESVIYLEGIDKVLSIFFRGVGGHKSKSIKSINLKEYQGKRKLIQKIAGVGKQFCVAEINSDNVFLPNKIDVFPSKELNKKLYFWQIMMSAYYNPKLGWQQSNIEATKHILQNYPSLKPSYNEMLVLIIKLRKSYKNKKLRDKEITFVESVKNGLLKNNNIQVNELLPFVLWVYPTKELEKVKASDDDNIQQENQQEAEKKEQIKSQKKAKKIEKEENDTDGLLMFLPEALPAWEEHVNVDRTEDDEFDENAAFIANNIEEMTIGDKAEGLSSRLKVDLDLPSADADDYPIGKGIYLPEWNFKKQIYLQKYCLLQPLLAKDLGSPEMPKNLQPLIKKLKAQLNLFLLNQYKQKRQDAGEEINIDAWIEFATEPNKAGLNQNFYNSNQRQNRELSTLILADLSLSTETYVDDETRIIDVVRDTLLIFAESINTLGDKFGLFGFSSVKNKMIRYHILKNFNEEYKPNIIQRINAIKPGFYTRLGAAVRQSIEVLEKQKTENKLLLIVSDGKPNDLDRYEGRYGVEDTKKAIDEAKKKGITPFCVTIDSESHSYLNYIFGVNNYTIVKNSKKLPQILPSIYFSLTQ